MDKEQKTLLIVGVGILFLWLAVRRYEAESDVKPDSERRPFADYEQPFYQQWVWKHDVFSYEGWTESPNSTIRRRPKLLLVKVAGTDRPPYPQDF